MLAPGGVSVGGLACEYTASLVARIGLEAAVTLVNGHMMQLDRHQKVVGLANGVQLPYDVLVLATGMQVLLLAGRRAFYSTWSCLELLQRCLDNL